MTSFWIVNHSIEWARRYEDRLREEGSRDDDRLIRMNRVNPKYVLRNYLAQTAIEKAQQKDFSEIDRLLTPAAKSLQRPARHGRLRSLRLPTGASIFL